jgi:hypothetical protein
LFVGDGAARHAEAVRGAFGADSMAEPVAPLLAGVIARLATGQAASGHRPPPHAIRPLYVRRADPPSRAGADAAAEGPRRAV